VENFKSIIKTLVIAFILSLGIRTYVAEAKVIPTESMVPTIKVGERVLVDKIYFKLDELKHEDIVVFRPTTELLKKGYKDDFIKRVIGLPGDNIIIRSGVVYVNNNPINEPYINEKPNQDYGPIKVPADSLFVMGDNRNYSSDSREWGFVPMENVKGRAIIKFWPLNRIELVK